MEPKAVQLIPIDQLVCEPQVRERLDEESLTGLAQSIHEVGVLQPLLVRRDGDRLVVVEGHRRIAASRKADLTKVPVIIDDQELSSLDVTLRQTVLNSQRQDLTPIERARAFSRLIEQSGWTAAEVARRTGFSEATISRLTALLTLPDDVVRRIDAGEIPASTAYQIAIAGNSEMQSKLAEETASSRLSRDRVVEKMRGSRRSPRPRQSNRPPRERVTVPLGAGRAVTVVGPGLNVETLIAWLEDLLTRIRSVNASGIGRRDLSGLLEQLRTCRRNGTWIRVESAKTC